MDAKRIRCGGSGPFGESFEACLFTTTLNYLRKTRPLDPRGSWRRHTQDMLGIYLPSYSPHKVKIALV